MTCETTTCKCVGEYCKCNQETDECFYEVPNETFSNFIPLNTVSRGTHENSSSLLMLILALVIAGITYYNRKSLNNKFAITCYIVAAAFIIIGSNKLITRQYRNY